MDLKAFMTYCEENIKDNDQPNEELVKFFSLFDRDGDGQIDSTELASVLNVSDTKFNESEAINLIKALKKENGNLFFKDFCSLMKDGLAGWRFRTSYRAIFLMGGPGSGKGTFYQEIKNVLINTAHISIGNLLRNEIESKTPLGSYVQAVIESGNLVESNIIIRLLRDTLKKHAGKYVFIDGFPRSIENAMDFYAVCGAPECAVWLNANDEVLINRLLTRGKTSGRTDDNLKSIITRLSVYHKAINVLAEHFDRVQLTVYKLDASKTKEEILQDFFQLPYFKQKLQNNTKNI